MFRHARLLVGKQTGRLKKKRNNISRYRVIRDVRKILFLSKEPWYIFTLVNLKLHQLEETLLDEHLGLSVNKLITGNTTEGSRRIEVGESARDKVGELACHLELPWSWEILLVLEGKLLERNDHPPPRLKRFLVSFPLYTLIIPRSGSIEIIIGEQNDKRCCSSLFLCVVISWNSRFLYRLKSWL